MYRRPSTLLLYLLQTHVRHLRQVSMGEAVRLPLWMLRRFATTHAFMHVVSLRHARACMCTHVRVRHLSPDGHPALRRRLHEPVPHVARAVAGREVLPRLRLLHQVQANAPVGVLQPAGGGWRREGRGWRGTLRQHASSMQGCVNTTGPSILHCVGSSRQGPSQWHCQDGTVSLAVKGQDTHKPGRNAIASIDGPVKGASYLRHPSWARACWRVRPLGRLV